MGLWMYGHLAAATNDTGLLCNLLEVDLYFKFTDFGEASVEVTKGSHHKFVFCRNIQKNVERVHHVQNVLTRIIIYIIIGYSYGL